MKWVTRQYVHVDRTACPWLIKRFIDPSAEFIFAPVDKIKSIVEKEKATPFDTIDAELGHNGEKCSFDAFIDKYGFADPALLELALIVRAADTDKLATIPEAAGLEAIMTGIGIESKDDFEAIQKASLVYDALYANIKLKILKAEYETVLEKLDRGGKREFLRSKFATH
jgi:hypothetical protein